MPDRLPLSVRRVYCIHTLFFCSAFVMWSLRPAGSVAHLELIACNVCFFFCFFLLHFRAISVLLGEKWKKMRSEERRVFTTQAKALADEQKRLNPDCWKRKRTNSVRRCTQNHATSQPTTHLTSGHWPYGPLDFHFCTDRVSEWWCRVPTCEKNQATHAHTLFNLVLFFHAVNFSVSSRVVREIRNADKKKEAASTACRHTRTHMQTWQGALHIFKLPGDILYRQTHLHVPQRGPDSFSKIWNLITVKTAAESVFLLRLCKKAQRCSVCSQTRRFRWDNNIMLRLGS